MKNKTKIQRLTLLLLTVVIVTAIYSGCKQDQKLTSELEIAAPEYVGFTKLLTTTYDQDTLGITWTEVVEATSYRVRVEVKDKNGKQTQSYDVKTTALETDIIFENFNVGDVIEVKVSSKNETNKSITNTIETVYLNLVAEDDVILGTVANPSLNANCICVPGTAPTCDVIRLMEPGGSFGDPLLDMYSKLFYDRSAFCDCYSGPNDLLYCAQTVPSQIREDMTVDCWTCSN